MLHTMELAKKELQSFDNAKNGVSFICNSQNMHFIYCAIVVAVVEFPGFEN